MNSILCSDQEAALANASTEHFAHRLNRLEQVRSTVATIIVKTKQEFETTRKPQPPSILERIEVPQRIYVSEPALVDTPSPRMQHEPVARRTRPTTQLPKPKSSKNFIQENIDRIEAVSKTISEAKPKDIQPKTPTKPSHLSKSSKALKTQKSVRSARSSTKQTKQSKPLKPILKSKAVPITRERFADSLSVKNPRILMSMYRQFTDLILLQWEEAAELVIDEILEEEVQYLNSLEEPSQPLPEGAFSVLEEIVREEQRLKSKYT